MEHLQNTEIKSSTVTQLISTVLKRICSLAQCQAKVSQKVYSWHQVPSLVRGAGRSHLPKKDAVVCSSTCYNALVTRRPRDREYCFCDIKQVDQIATQMTLHHRNIFLRADFACESSSCCVATIEAFPSKHHQVNREKITSVAAKALSALVRNNALVASRLILRSI